MAIEIIKDLGIRVVNSGHKKRIVIAKCDCGKVMWRSRITVSGKIISLGVYETKLEASIAYDNYVIENNLEHPINHKKKDGLQVYAH